MSNRTSRTFILTPDACALRPAYRTSPVPTEAAFAVQPKRRNARKEKTFLFPLHSAKPRDFPSQPDAQPEAFFRFSRNSWRGREERGAGSCVARTKRGARSWESGFEVTPEGGDRRSEVRGQVSGDERLVNSRQKGRKEAQRVLRQIRLRNAPIGAREAVA